MVPGLQTGPRRNERIHLMRGGVDGTGYRHRELPEWIDRVTQSRMRS
jgi:hypothetical protein